jgi:hypothetical protein
MLIIKLFLEHQPKQKPNGCNGSHPFEAALRHGHIPLLQLLIDHGTTFNGFSESIGEFEDVEPAKLDAIMEAFGFLMDIKYNGFIGLLSKVPGMARPSSYIKNLLDSSPYFEELNLILSTGTNTYMEKSKHFLLRTGSTGFVEYFIGVNAPIVKLFFIWAGQQGHRDILMYISKNHNHLLSDMVCASAVIKYLIEIEDVDNYYPCCQYPLNSDVLEIILGGCEGAYLFDNFKDTNGLWDLMWKRMTEEEREEFSNEFDPVIDCAYQAKLAQPQYYDGY